MMRVLCVFVIACGGAKSTGGPPPAEKASCDEPGRCLEDISNTLSAYHADARACFDKEHTKNPKLKGGAMKVQFTIDADGKVKDLSESSSDEITDPDVVQCVEGVVQKVQFPASAHKKTTRAYHKFEFGT